MVVRRLGCIANGRDLVICIMPVLARFLLLQAASANVNSGDVSLIHLELVMLTRFLVAACTLPLLTGLALSQTTPPTPAPSTSGSGTTQPGQVADPGLRTIDPTTVQVTFYTVQPADMPLSNLLELDVYNLQNEKVGEIEDVIIDSGKTVKAIVVGVGGFLGLGERYVSVDPGSLVITGQGDSMRAVINTTRDALRNAPEFKFEGNMKRTD